MLCQLSYSRIQSYAKSEILILSRQSQEWVSMVSFYFCPGLCSM